MENLKEAARILQVEPDMKKVLQARMEAVSSLLSEWNEVD